MKVAITGASGFLGNYLCHTLSNSGISLKVLAHKNVNVFTDINAEIIYGDILDKATSIKLIKDADVVYHLAAALSIGEKSKSLVHEINIKGTQNIIEACKLQKGTKLVHFSSVTALQTSGSNEQLDESAILINSSSSDYDWSKAEAERLVMEAAELGLDAVILNPTAIIGPFDSQPSYLGQALIRIYNNSLPSLVSGGYNFVDVRDVIEASISAASNGRKGERYILSGSWYSLKDIAQITGKITGNRTPKLTVPIGLARLALPVIQLAAKFNGSQPLYTAIALDNIEFSNKNISNLKARHELGFNPRPIESTLSDTFDWFEKHKMV